MIARLVSFVRSLFRRRPAPPPPRRQRSRGDVYPDWLNTRPLTREEELEDRSLRERPREDRARGWLDRAVTRRFRL